MTTNREYYDAFSEGYDERRSRGYHKLIDDQAAELVLRVGRDRDVLEVGCGTGLILQRVATEADSATGIDLSPGMLEHARARGLDVKQGSATELPFNDASFDLAYSFKVLAHVPEFDVALSEMQRVVRPGGHLVFDIYNRRSLRYLIKRLLGPMKTSGRFDEAAILTRFSTIEEVRADFPPNTSLARVNGIRTALAAPALLRVPVLAGALEAVEWRLMDTRLAPLAGFPVLTLRKDR